MKKITLMTGLLIAISTPLVQAECVAPVVPIIPDGNVASEDELITTSKAIKAFQLGDLTEYRNCLSELEKTLDVETDAGKEQAAEILNQFNTSVDSETAMSEKFNAAIRAFKARSN